MALDNEDFEDDVTGIARGDVPEVIEPEPAPEESDVPEPTPEPAPTKAPRDEKGKYSIPKERFDQAVGKERTARAAAENRVIALEKQLAERGAQTQQNQQIEQSEERVSTLEKQHSAYLLDGEGDKATAVMREIRHIERQIAKAEMRGD